MAKNKCRTSSQRKVTAMAAVQQSSVITQETVSTISSYKCNSCGEEFTVLEELTTHVSNHHPGDKTLQCPECNEIVCGSEEVIRIHQEVHLAATSESSSSLQKDLLCCIEDVVKAFVQEPSQCSVMQLGNFNSKTNNFMLTNSLPEKTHLYVPNKKKPVFDESVYKEQNIPVRYLCGVCNESFPHSRDYFIDHLVSVHFSKDGKLFKKTYTCHICDRQLTTKSSLNKHVKVQHSGQLEEVVCDECGKLVVKQRLHTHKYGHLRKECKYCHQMLAPRAWRRHKKFQENPKAKNDRKTSCMLGPPRRTTKSKVISCDFCNREVGKQTWIYHLAFQEVFGIACPESVPSPIQEQLQSEEQVIFLSRLQNAEISWNLKVKELREANATKIECTFCQKLLTRAHYKIHLRQHTGELRFECHFCSKLFAAKNMVHHHITTVHLKLGLNCRYCGKYFSRQTKLLAHEALHRGERNFKCPLCPKYFSGPTYVKGHVNLVHEKRYSYRNRKQVKNAHIILETPSILDGE